MTPYADLPARRAAQIVGDLAAIAIVVLTVVAAVAVHDAIALLADVGRRISDAGSGFQGTMAEVGEQLGEVPFIGSGIRAPFDAASGAGDALAQAGQAQEDLVLSVATWAGVLVAAGPIVLVLLAWVLPRVLGMRRAARARALALSPDGPELLALRALATRPIRELAAAGDRPLDAWRRGDPAAIRTLATLELRRAGVRLPTAG